MKEVLEEHTSLFIWLLASTLVLSQIYICSLTLNEYLQERVAQVLIRRLKATMELCSDLKCSIRIHVKGRIKSFQDMNIKLEQGRILLTMGDDEYIVRVPSDVAVLLSRTGDGFLIIFKPREART
ncbi:MAG: hypothetical protein DRN15_06960 [Thermoprotei archaeon]|nr:MAG: hypothetical protein DRN15_06960 [Thermoprotei archaeon]RLF24146.1 MAG: hypothetical protein DRM97_03900 [Thermoprotei archaeon]